MFRLEKLMDFCPFHVVHVLILIPSSKFRFILFLTQFSLNLNQLDFRLIYKTCLHFIARLCLCFELYCLFKRFKFIFLFKIIFLYF
jgi:hypothetical protein